MGFTVSFVLLVRAVEILPQLPKPQSVLFLCMLLMLQLMTNSAADVKSSFLILLTQWQRLLKISQRPTAQIYKSHTSLFVSLTVPLSVLCSEKGDLDPSPALLPIWPCLSCVVNHSRKVVANSQRPALAYPSRECSAFRTGTREAGFEG